MDGLTYSVATPFVSRAHKSTLAFGLHEMEERTLVRRWLPHDVPVIELGGGLGVVSCLVNKKLDYPSDHIVVEANPSLVPILERNRRLNHATFKIVNKAIAYDRDSIELGLDEEFVGSAVGRKSGNVAVVEATTVAALASPFDRFGIVCDIEGAEIDLVEREFPALGDRTRYLLLETHPKISGQHRVETMLGTLASLGFRKTEHLGDCYFFIKPQHQNKFGTASMV
jgi:FkbM family methyltransferase